MAMISCLEVGTIHYQKYDYITYLRIIKQDNKKICWPKEAMAIKIEDQDQDHENKISTDH